MVKRLWIAGPLLAIAMLVAADASAATIPIDPIVRVRGSSSGSIQIFELPFSFDFSAFPSNPDPENCAIGSEEAGTIVACHFQNLTGQTISLLDLSWELPSGSEGLVFSIEDPDGLFNALSINEGGARFVGGGIESGFCEVFEEEFRHFRCEPKEECVGGDFYIELVGFPEGTSISLTAERVPEPGALALFGTGLAVASIAVRRRRRND